MPAVVLPTTPSCIDTPLTITTSVLSLATIALSLIGAYITVIRLSRTATTEATSLFGDLDYLQGRVARLQGCTGDALCVCGEDGATELGEAAERTRIEVDDALRRLGALGEGKNGKAGLGITWRIGWTACGGRRRMEIREARVRGLVADIGIAQAELRLQSVHRVTASSQGLLTSPPPRSGKLTASATQSRLA